MKEHAIQEKTSADNQSTWVCLFVGGKDICVMSANDNGIQAFTSEKEAQEKLTAPYVENFSRGGTWATGVTLHWLSFQPKVLEVVGGIPEIERDLIDPNGAQICRFRTDAGSCSGIVCTRPAAREVYDNKAKALDLRWLYSDYRNRDN